MIILKEKKTVPIKESNQESIPIDKQEAWRAIMNAFKSNGQLFVQIHPLTGGHSFSEAKYNKLRVSGNVLLFKHNLIAENSFTLFAPDIADATKDTDLKTGAESIKLLLKTRFYIIISPTML